MPAVALAAGLAAGCAGPSQSATPTADVHTASAAQHASHAECLVCKYNADLACVDVPVENQTPRAEYNGRTYYFCSDECRAEFLKHPEKYAK
jgi:Cu+-exporting ATPase